jgi:hypothetical protein
MNVRNTIKKSVKLSLAVVAFGAAGLAAVPAQAASFTFGSGMTHNGVVLRFTNGHFTNNYCLSNSEIRQQLRAHGFHQVSIIRSLGHNKVLAVGLKGSHWYQLVVDSCTGGVDQQRVRRSSNGGFSFSFTFGNGGSDNHDHPGQGGYGGGFPGGGGNGGFPGNGGGNPGHEKLVCLVTFFDASQVAAGADANVESARVLPKSVAEAQDRPNDRRGIFDYGSDQQTISTCNYLDQLNN